MKSVEGAESDGFSKGMGKGLVGLKVMFFFCIVRVTTNNNHLQVDQASLE